MFPTTCVTFSHTSLPPTRKCVSSLFTDENVTPGFMLPAQRPLNLLCKRSDGGMHTHAHKQNRWQAELGWEQVLYASLVPNSCYKHHKIWPSRLVSFKALYKPLCLAFKLQFPEGASPPQDSLCGNGGKTLLLG